MTTYPDIHNTYITIDEDTEVGYSFEESNFYITNKSTTTYRSTAEKTKAILDIVAPNNTITKETIQSFSTSKETIINLYYTWDDNGRFIKTIQFNRYDKYPLTLDADRKKIYIMNTETVFDLSIVRNVESIKSTIINYYSSYLGLNITSAQMTTIYNLLISYYNPYCYNEIDQDTLDKTLKYTGTYTLSNFSGSSDATYSCESNPDDTYSSSQVGNILKLDSNTNKVYFTSTIPSTIKVGGTVIIVGTTITEESYSYDSNGSYTVSSISSSENSIVLNEQISNSYEAPVLYLKESPAYNEITKITVDEGKIYLSSSDVTISDIGINDKIYVTGTTYDDGEYIVSNVFHSSDGSGIQVLEVPNNNFSGSGATIYKRVLKGEVANVNVTDKQIALTSTPTGISASSKVILSYLGNENVYTVSNIANNIITISEAPTSITYPTISIPVASTEVLITVDTSEDESILPTGEFMVDNFSQCQAYLGTYSGLVVPSTENNSSINSEVPTTKTIEVSGGAALTMILKGVYSRVYS